MVYVNKWKKSTLSVPFITLNYKFRSRIESLNGLEWKAKSTHMGIF